MKRNAMVLMVTMAMACGSKKSEDKPPPAKDDKVAAKAKPAETKVEVKLCDNHTTTAVNLANAKTQADGQRISDALMAQWRAKNPDQEWVTKAQKSWTVAKPADNDAVLADGTQRHTYGNYNKRDVLAWARESEMAATEGARVFHNADELGSTIAVSCDMCHPDGANTHPETYPKYQVQLGRVVLLRDMINWCIEHPLRGKPMAADDARMRALESYIYAQRKGVPLAYGKH